MFSLIKLTLVVLAIVVLLPVSLNVQAQNVSAQLDEPFELRIGGNAELAQENMIVTFSDVVQDSRCPSDAVCIWEGQATTSVRLQLGDSDPQEFVLTIGADKSPTAVYGQYSVTLVDLQPYPQSSVQTDPRDYTATLSVSKAPANSAGVFVRAASDASAAIVGWNLELGKGTLVILNRGDSGTTMSVARFTPVAAQCTISDANECIDGHVINATGIISQNTIVHLEVSSGKLITTSDGVHSLDIKRIRTTGPASPT